MTVTVGMLRPRLASGDETAPLNLLVTDQDLERMIDGLTVYIGHFEAIKEDCDKSDMTVILSLFANERTETDIRFTVADFLAVTNKLSAETAVRVVPQGRKLKAAMASTRLRIANAFLHMTERGATEFTFEIALED